MLRKLLFLPLFAAIAMIAMSGDELTAEPTDQTESVSAEDGIEAEPTESESETTVPETVPPEMPAELGGVPLLLKVVAVSEDTTSFDVVFVELSSGKTGEPLTYAWSDLRVCRAGGSSVSVEEVKKAIRVGQPIYWVDLPEKLDPTFREALADRTLIVSPIVP